ncbi:MAG: hypothetical protein IT555_01435 [Acetobacteraceae bacterium]|nr:hypothetical protein [Acetobacteraceae bacterium]
MRDILPKPDPAVQASPSAAVPPAAYPGGIRVADKVVMAFNHACSVGDLEAAEELLVVLEKIAERRIRRFGGDRRRETFTVCHAREHLEWHRAQRLG